MEGGVMDRFVLSLKQGFAIVESDGWGRYIGNDGRAFDLDEEKHSELIQKVMARGEKAVANQSRRRIKL